MMIKKMLMVVMLLFAVSVPVMAEWTYVDCVDHKLHPDAATGANMYYNPDGTGPVEASDVHTDDKPRFRTWENTYSFGNDFYEVHKTYGDPPVYVHIDTGAAGVYSIKFYGVNNNNWTCQVSLDGGVTWSDNFDIPAIDAVNGIDGQGWVDNSTGLGSPVVRDGVTRGNIIVGNVGTTDGHLYIGIRTDSSDRGWFDGLAYTESMGIAAPDPSDGEDAVEVDLSARDVPGSVSWIIGTEPNIVTVFGYNVYMDPNETKVLNATPVSTDLEFKSLQSGGQTGSSFDLDADLSYGTSYYWRVEAIVDFEFVPGDTINDANTLTSDVWSFTTQAAFPTVDAGDDLYTSLELALNGLTLNGSYSDADGTATTSTWSVLTDDVDYPGGNHSFGDASSPVTTFTTDTAGRYLLKLFVPDPDYPGVEYSDVIEVIVVEDSCDAAKASPDGYTKSAYDLNDDCIVNLLDFAMMAGDWLADRLLDAPVEYEGDTSIIEIPASDDKLGSLVLSGTQDGWTQCIINLGQTYTNNSGAAQTIDLKYFAFTTADDAASPVTPFVVEVVDNLTAPNMANYKVVAIGTTRTLADYTQNAVNTFDFADTPTQIIVEDGATIAVGFLDANPDGTDSAVPDTTITFTYPSGAQSIFSGGNAASDSASIAVGTAPSHNADTESLLTNTRQYNFIIGFDVN